MVLQHEVPLGMERAMFEKGRVYRPPWQVAVSHSRRLDRVARLIFPVTKSLLFFTKSLFCLNSMERMCFGFVPIKTRAVCLAGSPKI